MHIALIPDGNRRWARARRKPVWYGHSQGAKKMEEFIQWCVEHPEIKTLSIYALSTENLNRPKKELNKLWQLYSERLSSMLHSSELKKHKIKVNIVGNPATWRADVRQAARDLMRATRNYTGGVLNILLAYGSKFEIVKAVQNLMSKGVKRIPNFQKWLLVPEPVDLLIRTGGQCRLSNFLLYQAAYAEIYFSKTLWPDFTKREFEKIMRWYKKQQRKFGR